MLEKQKQKVLDELLLKKKVVKWLSITVRNWILNPKDTCIIWR